MTADLSVALNPKSIAVIGASENVHKIGGRPIHFMQRFGYRGKLYPINPKRAEVQGLPTFPHLRDLPEVPEVVIIAVPGEAALEAVRDSMAAGVKVAILMSSGFGETADGKEREDRMVAAARAKGLRIVGPNSQGLANFGNGAICSFSTLFLEAPPADGPVAIVSQSGAMSVVPYGFLRGRDIGVRHVHATGNDCDVTVPELATVVARDPDVELLLLYLENLTNSESLVELARVAHARDLPVIALKTGRTPAGQAAAKSHTGALANEDRVVDAFFEQHGIRRVRDMVEMTASAELYLKRWKPKGKRLVVISNSGASCVMGADAASDVGMPMAKLADDTKTALRAILPSFSAVENPIDITAALLTNSRLFGEILPVIARDPAADAFVIGIPVSGAGYDVEAFARDTAAFAAETGKPVVMAIPQPNVAATFKPTGLPIFAVETQAVEALNGFISHRDLMARSKGREFASVRRVTGSGDTTVLNEAESLDLLAGVGVPVVDYRLCLDEDAAVNAAAALKGPVVLKGCSADVTHKSELGLVRVGVTAADDVRTAFRDMQRILKEHGYRFQGMIVAPMVRGRRELLIGAHRDSTFGPVVVVGEGGKYVEVLPDFRILLPPFNESDARAALSLLRIAPLLAGVRGEPPVDLTRFCAAAAAIGKLMLNDDAIVSIDINPLIVGAGGEGCAAVDAVVIRSAY
jgi:acyl-CoA synthetase (NDP forming)